MKKWVNFIGEGNGPITKVHEVAREEVVRRVKGLERRRRVGSQIFKFVS